MHIFSLAKWASLVFLFPDSNHCRVLRRQLPRGLMARRHEVYLATGSRSEYWVSILFKLGPF